MAETHIASIDVTVDGRYLRQRCAWCGAVLLDYDLALIAVPEGQDPTPGTWPAGALVRTDGAVSSVVEAEVMPDDACARIDPAITT